MKMDLSFDQRMERTFAHAPVLPLDRNTRYILFSDCHRGVGDNNDNFLRNEFLYVAALETYFRKGYTYIELGDGDELWENRSMKPIRQAHQQSFELLEKFRQSGRFYMVYGNHDMGKRKGRALPGIILKDAGGGRDIYLTHGHQADLLNSTFWRLSKFLVRYVWRPLERLGVSDPTSAAKNNTKKRKTEQRLSDWAKERGHLLIAGHTHHPMGGDGGSSYFNTGSCIHPGAITGIEIDHRCIALVRWSLSVREDLSLCAVREVISERVCMGISGKKENASLDYPDSRLLQN